MTPESVCSTPTELDAGLEVDLALAEGALELLGQRRVLQRAPAVGSASTIGDVDAERLPHRRELDADDAAADDDDALRELGQREGLGRW